MEALGKHIQDTPKDMLSDIDQRRKEREEHIHRVKMEVAFLESQDNENEYEDEYEEEPYRYESAGEIFQEILDLGYSGDAKHLFHTAEQYRVQKYGQDSLPLGDFYCGVFQNLPDPDPRGRKEQFLGKQMLTDILQKCIAIYEKHNVHDMEVENDDDLSRKYSLMLIYEQLSTYYKEQKQYQTALIWTEKLLNLEQYFYDAKGVNSLRFYQESAEIYALQNKFESAIEYYNKALELQKEAKKSGILIGSYIDIHHSLISIYRKQGHFEKAIDSYKDLIKQITSNEGNSHIINTLKTRIELANTYVEMYNFNEAYSLFSDLKFEMEEYKKSIPENKEYDLGEAQYFLKEIYTHMLAFYTVEGVHYNDEIQTEILDIQQQDSYKKYVEKKERIDKISRIKKKTDKERIYDNEESKRATEKNARAISALEQDVGILKKNIIVLNAWKDFFKDNKDVWNSLVEYETELKELRDSVEKIQKDEILRKGYYEALSTFKKEYIMAMVVGMNKLKQKTPAFDIVQRVGELSQVIPGTGDLVSLGAKNTARMVDKGIQKRQRQEAEKLFDTLITVSREQEFFIRLSSDVVFRNKEAIKKGGDVKEIVAKEVQVILGILRDSDTAKKIEGKSHKEIVSILYDIHESSQKSLLDKRKEVWRNIFQ